MSSLSGSEMTGNKDRTWLLTYFPAAWLGHACQGLAMGILGPTQPYLALMVSVPIARINFIWTLRALGSCLSTLVTGAVFKSLVTRPGEKLTFLATCVLLTGLFMGLVPWASSFYVLLITIFLAGVFLAGLDTASNSLVVAMLGPQRAPPFTQSLHAMVGLGFVLGSLLARPFLPDTRGGEDNIKVCDGLNSNSVKMNVSLESDDPNPSEYQLVMDGDESEMDIPNLIYPFTIIMSTCIISAAAYISLICCRIPMPFYKAVSQEDTMIEDEEDGTIGKKEKRFPKLIYIFAFLYFAFSCGMEGFFQSQTFTFGICGPHKLNPKEAAFLTTVYFASFLVGRFSGVLLSSLVRPAVMILASLVSCVMAALLLSLTAATSLALLYTGVGVIGFFISLQFASGYSWLAGQVDLTGPGSSVVFLGANLGWLVFPPLAGMVIFSPVGPMGVFYLTLGLSVAHLLVFICLFRMSII